MRKLSSMTEKELIIFSYKIMSELKSREVIRTRNNPIADYCEWFVSRKFNWTLQTNSNAGFDVLDRAGQRVQIKCRTISVGSGVRVGPRQLGVIRNLEMNTFDYLIAILFDEKVEVVSAYKISKPLIRKYSKFNKHQNGHILSLKGDLLKDHRLEDITRKLK